MGSTTFSALYKFRTVSQTSRGSSKMNDERSSYQSWRTIQTCSRRRTVSTDPTICRMTELTTSTGQKRFSLQGRYLEIQRFATASDPGKGKYFKGGKMKSVFTFGEDGMGEQRNGRPFSLQPIMKGGQTIGWIWTMPEYPFFEAKSDGGSFLKPLVRQQQSSLWKFKQRMSCLGNPQPLP